MKKSCLYQGNIRHRRFQPVKNEFCYDIFMVYLDLSELDTAFSECSLWSASKAAPASFCRTDHLGDPLIPLDEEVRKLIKERTGANADGPIRLLTHLRYFGHCFNPVSFYFCYDRSDTRVEFMVAEVNNTPWHEQYCYVFDERGKESKNGWHCHRFPKIFHVSPFIDLTVEYDWHYREPGSGVNFHMTDYDRGSAERIFDATLKLDKLPLTRRNMLKMLFKYPFLTARIVFLIHWQALRLWLKGAVFYWHPTKRDLPPEVYHVHKR